MHARDLCDLSKFRNVTKCTSEMLPKFQTLNLIYNTAQYAQYTQYDY